MPQYLLGYIIGSIGSNLFDTLDVFENEILCIGCALVGRRTQLSRCTGKI